MLIPVPMGIRGAAVETPQPLANWILIGLNVLAYLVLTPSSSWVGPGTPIWTILTYGFVHASLFHLVFNLWFLWLFGNALNRRIGNGYYVLLVLGTLLAIGLFARLFAPGYVLGSSGAVFAVIAAAALLMPVAPVDVHYLAFFPLTVPIGLIRPPRYWLFWFVRWDRATLSAIVLLLVFTVLELMALIVQLAWHDVSWTNLAHLLGMICGVAGVLLMPTRITMRPRARAL